MPTIPIFLVSLLLHAFVGWSIAPDLPDVDASLGVAIWVLLMLSALLMPLGFIARRFTKRPLSEFLTWLGLLCVGLGSLLFVLTLLLEAMLLAARALGWVWPTLFSMADFRADTALMLPVVGFLVTLLGFWNARRTASVVRVDVPIADLPEALQGFNVAQIRDIHLGPTIKGPYLVPDRKPQFFQ